MKLCTKCGETKPSDQFGRGKNSRDGLYYWCKACVKVNNDSRKHRPKVKVERLACSGCMDVKPIADFHNSSVSKTGYATRCKSCKSAKHFANKDKINAAQRKYRAENRDEVLSKENAWREANAEKVLNNREKYLREHKGERAALQNKRRAAKINATPSWADEAYIKDLYVNCREAEVVFERAGISVKFEVDHILPLQGKSVCGLHMEANLQILTAAENAQKHNCIT